MSRVRQYTARKTLKSSCCSCSGEVCAGDLYREMVGINEDWNDKPFARYVIHEGCIPLDELHRCWSLSTYAQGPRRKNRKPPPPVAPMPTLVPRTLSHEDWLAEAAARFGSDPLGWKFACPCCGFVAAILDWKEAGAPRSAAGVSCVGRWRDGTSRQAFGSGQGPCNYAGFGLIRLNPVTVLHPDGESTTAFEFAEAS